MNRHATKTDFVTPGARVVRLACVVLSGCGDCSRALEGTEFNILVRSETRTSRNGRQVHPSIKQWRVGEACHKRRPCRGRVWVTERKYLLVAGGMGWWCWWHSGGDTGTFVVVIVVVVANEGHRHHRLTLPDFFFWLFRAFLLDSLAVLIEYWCWYVPSSSIIFVHRRRRNLSQYLV